MWICHSVNEVGLIFLSFLPLKPINIVGVYINLLYGGMEKPESGTGAGNGNGTGTRTGT